jgi:putative flippase GtrA
VIVLVPAYEPDERLVDLVAALHQAAPTLRTVIVDDGSGPSYAQVFAAARALGATVLGWPENRGKAAALRAGFAWAQRELPGHDVVCADCDGQHGPADVLRVAGALRPGDTMVLGVRRFTGRVPARSRLGNAVTRAAFRAATGAPVTDTQTGLRAYPASVLGWARQVPGERFAYELELLLHAAREGRTVREVEIATIYLEGNASSHFRPLVDSAQVYLPLVRFSLASLTGFVVDTVVLLTLHGLTGAMLPSVVVARVTSAAANFLVNRRLVFARDGGHRLRPAAARYAVLAVGLLAASYGMLRALTGAGVPLLAAKVVTDASLFAVSFVVQRRFVFPAGAAARPGAAHVVTAAAGDRGAPAASEEPGVRADRLAA